MAKLLHVAVIVMATVRWALAFSSAGWKHAWKSTTRRSLSHSIPTQQFRFFSSTTPNPTTQNEGKQENDPASIRQKALHQSLQKIQLDPIQIEQANSKNMEDPTTGYDAAFGRPAIRAYRSFLYSKNIPDDLTQSMLAAQADNCARQIEFLRRRHLAHQTDWVRHTDSEDKLSEHQVNPPRRFPLIMVLDNIRSAFNVGSLFRTADACGVQEVITVSYTNLLYFPNFQDKLKPKCWATVSPFIASHWDYSTSRWIRGRKTEQVSSGGRKASCQPAFWFHTRSPGCNESRVSRLACDWAGNH